MRYLFSFALFAMVLGHSFSAESKPLPAKTRAMIERLDTRISKLRFEMREAGPKLADYMNKVLTLREKVNEAKAPANIERLTKALEKAEEQQNYYDALIKSQKLEVAQLMTRRRVITGAKPSESITERNANLGVADDETMRAARIAAERGAFIDEAKASPWKAEPDASDLVLEDPELVLPARRK